jgi:CelD/BcsL family acetyltransferase involved in cellulose biosynthesis
LKLKLVTNFKELEPHAAAWNSLVLKNETNTVFQLYEWHKSWWEAYGNTGLLYLILVFEKNDIVGIAPLMLVEYGLYGNLMQFIGEGRSDYCDFIIPEKKETILKKILEFISKKHISWNTFHLNNIPEYSSTIRIIQKICKEINKKYLIKRYIPCPTLILNDDQHNKKILSQKTLRRRFNYFTKNGELKFHHIRDINVVKENLSVFYNQHIERVRLKGQKSLFVKEIHKIFYEKLIENMFIKNYVLFSRLDYNSQPIAYHFGFLYNNKLVWYKPSYDVSVKKWSPGAVLLKFLIEYAIQENLNEFDFTVGHEEFKQRFANGLRKNIQIELYNDNFTYIYSLLKDKILTFLKLKES